MKIGEIHDIFDLGKCTITGRLGPFRSKSSGNIYYLYVVVDSNGNQYSLGPEDFRQTYDQQMIQYEIERAAPEAPDE